MLLFLDDLPQVWVTTTHKNCVQGQVSLERKAANSGGNRDNDTTRTPRGSRVWTTDCLRYGGHWSGSGSLTERGSFPATALHANSQEDHRLEITHGAYTDVWILSKMCGKCSFCSWKAEASVVFCLTWNLQESRRAKRWRESVLGDSDERGGSTYRGHWCLNWERQIFARMKRTKPRVSSCSFLAVTSLSLLLLIFQTFFY